MPIPIRIADLVEAMESQFDESTSYLNRRSGEIVTVRDEEFHAVENEEPGDDFSPCNEELAEVAKDVLTSEDYVRLPDRFEIHEYSIMEEYCLSLTDPQLREEMCRAIKGSGAFRRFKDLIRRFNLTDDWYRYRDAELKKIAVTWCEAHELEFVD